MTSVAKAAAAPPVIDVDALLSPIPGDNPAGEPPSVLYDEIKQARGGGNPKDADWARVLSLTTDALKTRTKDLGVCGWMTEALVKLHGLAGLRDGLRVLRGLHESFWDNLYPPVGRNGSLEGRANHVESLGKWASIALRDLPLTDAEAAGVAYTYWDWQFTERDTAEAKQRAEDWERAVAATPLAFYEAARATAEDCWQEFEKLLLVMDERLGNYNLGTGPLRDTLEDIRDRIRNLYEAKAGGEPAPAPARADGDAAAPPAGGGAAVKTTIKTRQEAVRQLREVAAFFRQTEPQSPVSYLVERAIRWSEMPLEAWLATVIKDPQVLGFVHETLGVSPDGDKKDRE